MEWKELLLNLRKERGLSQAELAEELGISRQTVSRWEKGLAQPSSENLIGLSKVYGMTVEELYTHFDLAEVEGKEEEPPVDEDEQKNTAANEQTKHTRKHFHKWLRWLILGIAFCGGVLIWGKITHSMGVAIMLLEFVVFLAVAGWLLYNLREVFSHLKIRKDDK